MIERWAIITRSDYKFDVARVTWYNRKTVNIVLNVEFNRKEDAEAMLEMVRSVGLKKVKKIIAIKDKGVDV